MVLRVVLAATMLLALVVVAGCSAQPNVYTPEQFHRLMLARGDGAQLFGPTPLALGREDLGYFASLKPVPGAEVMFDSHQVYTRTWIYDVEDNRAPNQSYNRRQTYSDDIRASYR